MTLVTALLSGSAGALVALVLYLFAPAISMRYRVSLLRDLGMMWVFVMWLAPLGAWVTNVVLVLTLGPPDVPWVHRLVTVLVLSFAAAAAFIAAGSSR